MTIPETFSLRRIYPHPLFQSSTLTCRHIPPFPLRYSLHPLYSPGPEEYHPKKAPSVLLGGRPGHIAAHRSLAPNSGASSPLPTSSYPTQAERVACVYEATSEPHQRPRLQYFLVALKCERWLVRTSSAA